MVNKDFWGQFEEAPSISVDNTLNSNDEYWKQFETAENNFDKELFNNKVNNSLNYDGAVIENRKPFTHKPIGNTSISNYDPKNKIFNPYNHNPLESFIQSLKWIVELPSKAFEETNNQLEISKLENMEMADQIFGTKNFRNNNRARLNYLNNNMGKTITETIEEPKYKQKDPLTATGILERVPYNVKYAYAAFLKQLPILYNIGKDSLISGVGGAGVGAGTALIAGQLGPQAATPEEVITVPGGASIGFVWGSRIGAAKKVFEIETGLARNELKQINQQIINEGGIPLSNEEINGLAIGVGSLNAGLEFISLKAMLKTVPGGNEILKKLEQKQLKELARDKTVREQLSKVIKNYSTAVLTESTTEMAQEFTNIIADRKAREIGGIENPPLEQEVARIINAGKEAFAAALFLGGIGSTAQTARIYTLQGMDKQSALKKAKSMSFDERHDFVNNNQDILLDDIKNIPSVQELEKNIKKSEQAMQASDKIFNDLKSANIDDEQASSLSQLMGIAYANIAEGDTQGRNALDIYNNYNVTIKGGISKDVISENTPISDTQAEAFNQSAMYRSPKEDFADFYKQVFEKETEAKKNNSKIQKSYFDFTNESVSVRIPHDTIVHDNNKHKLAPEEWQEILNNLSGPADVAISNKPRFNGQPVILKIIGDNSAYGVVIETFKNKQPIITTAFTDTEANIDNWLNNNKEASRARNTSAVTTKGLLPSSASVDIINHLKENLKPNSFNDSPSVLKYNQGAFDNEQRQQQKQTSTTEVGADGSSNTADNERISRAYKRRSHNGTSGRLVDSVYFLPDEIKTHLNNQGYSTPDFNFLKNDDDNSANYFRDSLLKAKDLNSQIMASVYIYDTAEYKKMKLFITDEGDSGFAIKSDGTLVSVFSYPKGQKRNKSILNLAISQGATKLDCYDTYLPKIYKQYGFKEINRVSWDEKYKPEDWDKEYYSKYNKGEPDVIFMELKKDLKSENTYFQSAPPVNLSTFKKWFGDSKVVDENGNPLVVYHGTTASFDIFKANNASTDYDFPDGMYFSNSKEIAKTYGDYKHTKPMELYLKIENPLILDAKEKSYNAFYDELYSSVKNIDKNKYDGIIIKNIRDDWSQNNDGGEIATTYIVFEPEQIKSVNNRGTFEANNPDIYYQNDIDSVQKEWQEQGTESSYFKNWFKNSKVINEDGSPRVVHHGSVNTFSIFDKDRAEVTGDMGAGFYFTSSNQDASLNYEGGGPDFEQKVSLYAERIMDKENIEDYETAEDMARERLMGEPSKLDIYLSMQNPAYVDGKNKTYLFTEEEYDTSDILQEDYDSEEDYRTAIDEDLYSQFENNLYRIESAISDLLSYDSVQDVLQVLQSAFYDGGISIQKLKDELNKLYLQDYDTGNIVANEVLRRIVESQGYDGIIDETVSNKFNMGLSSDTVHYIVFEPEQIKSVDNRGTFDVGNPNIYYQPVYHGSPYKFDNFSLDKIGTGEGAQAHGWGLYFAENKEVSERYRKNLSGDIKILYKGEQYDIEENFGNALYKIKKYGKDKAIEFYKDKEKEFRAEAKTSPNPRWWEYEADNFKIYADEVKNIDENDIEILEGQLFQVDIPENDVLLDENKSLSEQPEKVIQALRTMDEKEDLGLFQYEFASYTTGEQIYERIGKLISTRPRRAEMTSKLLNKYGIKGITYNGLQDGRCYVIFDDKAISVLETYYQQQQNENNRGSISFFRDEEGNIRKTLIDLISGKADKSTAAHEFGHLFLQTLIVESDTNLKAREMLLEVNKWLGYNGKEYTQAQHEKFARGFEAYLASGKAPTYKLKQVFEKFKKWLKDIYLSIKYNTDIVLSPEAEQVFNKIFGEENFEELNKKKADILKRAKEFGQTRYKPTEEQLRYKNIAYDILSTGLRRNPNWLKSVLESGSNTRAMQKKRERIEFDLRKIQDPYSSGSGMLPEWREFFTDPGVSYENNVAGADYELAQQAYDVIINRSWERTNEEYYELQQTENEYEYLLKEFKNAKNTDDRTTVLIAHYDWLESIDEIVQEQYGERWVHDTNEIERFEQLNKFEQAKEILIKNSDLLKNSNGITEYKNVVQAVLKQLNFLTAFERNKILGVVSEITSAEELKNNINEIMDFAETLQDVTARKNMSENIQKELMATKNIRKNGKTYGKYDYSTNKLFSRLREVNKLRREDAEAEYTTLLEEFEAMSEEQKESLSFEDKLYKKFVTYKAHGNVYISSDFLSSLYQDIVFAKMQGRLSKNSADFENRINNNAAIEKVLDRLEKKKPANNITKFYTKFANLESFINLFLDKKFVDEYSILYEETQVQSKSYLEKQSVLKEMANILNVKPFFIDDEIFKKLNEKYTFKDYSLKRPREIELNKMQLIEAYIYSKNPVIKQRLINMFSEGGYDRIMSLLNPDDIKIGDLLQRTAEKYYNPVNQIYIKKYGIDMPKAKNYFPVSADVVQELDLFNQYTEQSTAPKFFKTRTSSVFVPIKLSNPVQSLFTHIEKANNLILLEEKLSKLNRVFKDRTVKQFISDLYGEEAYNGFIKQISDCSYTKKAEMLSAVDGMINKLVNNTIVATISLKPKIMATQLVSVINFSEKMPSALWFGGFLKALSNPKATIKFMMENDYLQQRFGEGAQNEALARIVKASDFHKSKKFIDLFSLNVKLGDIGAIIFGGKPYVDYLIQHKKMSKEEAFKEFVLEVNRAQQAATTSSLADYQKSKNPIFRLYYAFQNTTNQYFRKTADAIISKANGDISSAEMAKTVLIYTVFNNFLYRMVANPYVWILGLSAGDWEDFAKEVVNSVFDLNSQALIGIGNLYQAILNALLDKPFYLTAKGLDKIPFDVHKIISEAKDGLENIKLDTWLNAIGDIMDTTTGAPASTIINAGSTPANISDGQIGTAILKILGYSDYQAKRAFNIED